MQKNKLNNVIVLKELSSNIVEEAIVFLKPNINLKENELIKIKDKTISKFNKNSMVVEEAENVIKNHINEFETNQKVEDIEKVQNKYKKLKKISMILLIINIFCIFKIF